VEGYVELDGLRAWYAEHGGGEPVVMLHPGGAGVDARGWAPNLGAISAHFRVFTPERRGHGRTPDVPGAIGFEAMAADTIAFLETVVGGWAHWPRSAAPDAVGRGPAPDGMVSARLKCYFSRALSR
jgi:pimeloyl-ACP methyl ester carboxylesterase